MAPRILASEDPNIVTAKPGKNVTLKCHAPNSNIIIVEWTRVDLGKKWVLLYRDGRLEDDDQHPSFVNRVDLQDIQMKDGDVSLILKNVTTADAGIYKCRVAQKSGQPMSLITTINLTVVPPAL
ncbi:unnamed protein product [Oreochromis niloticus]|nr:unnamed protein product [Mustela putorius furo]